MISGNDPVSAIPGMFHSGILPPMMQFKLIDHVQTFWKMLCQQNGLRMVVLFRFSWKFQFSVVQDKLVDKLCKFLSNYIFFKAKILSKHH